MDTEEHYDTPWEFKNKAIAAVLSGVMVGGAQPGRSPKATDENFFEEDLASPSQSNSIPSKKSSPLQIHPIQPCSSQPIPIYYLDDQKKSTKQGFRVSQNLPSQRHSPPHLRRFSTASCDSRQNHAIPPVNACNPSFERAAKPCFNPTSRVPIISNLPLSPGPSTGQWIDHPTGTVLAYPLVGKLPYGNELKRDFTVRNGQQFGQSSHPKKSTTFDEANMVHEGMERMQAEQLLKPMGVGDFLLRRRNEGSLALSLRSLDGVLHIKLEMRDALWVLGEGPKFSSISGMLRCYRKNELPVRGAEHVRLKSPLTTAEVAMVMQTIRRKSQSP